jgi:hypothetical protein
MAEPARKWEVIEDEPDEAVKADARQDAAPNGTPLGLDLLLLSLKTLSQRTITAVTNLFTLTTMTGTWWLWYKTPDPQWNQIVSLSIFAAFVLAANWLVRRK